MKKYIFDNYSTRLLRDIKFGEAGYVLLDPQNNDPKGTTILTNTLFAIRNDLYFFNNLSQVKRFLLITNSRLYILGIKKTGLGFDGRSFVLDFSFLKWEGFIGFNTLYSKKDNYLDNRNYICFLNIKINKKKIDMDEFLLKKKKYYSGETYCKDKKINIIEQNHFLLESINANDSINTLKTALHAAIALQDFEKAAIIRDYIKENKQKSDY